MASRARFLLFVLVLAGCGKDENAPDMGAVPPKPNLAAAANAPGASPSNARPGADAEAMRRTTKRP